MKEITVVQLKEKIDSKADFILLDVREAFETHISNIDIHSLQIPREELEQKLKELDKNAEVIVMCRSGNRSGTACVLLEEKGFTNVANLKGGINEWSRKIDPSLPVY